MRFSLRAQISLVFAALLVSVAFVLNSYPVRTVRNQMITSAQSELDAGGQTLSAALSSLPKMTADLISETVSLLDSASNKRVTVTNELGVLIYDSQKSSQLMGKVILLPEVTSAMEGYDSFSFLFKDNYFIGTTAMPIVKDGIVTGTVFLYKYDTENPRLLAEVRDDMVRITIIVLLALIMLVVVFNLFLSKRFETLLTGIGAVGGGDYDYRIQMRGNDELAEISRQFNDMSQKLEKTEAMRQQFVSDASHELKTPLSSIKLLSDSIRQNDKISDENLREFVYDIGDEINRLINISEDLLSLSRLEDNQPKEPEICNLNDIVRKCETLLKGLREHADVAVHLNFEGEHNVMGTPDGLFHVVFNLMENAIKYNGSGGNLWVTISRLSGEVCMKIKDDGMGIPIEDRARIFDRFYRVDKARARDTGGSGLGLAIALEWVNKMGGRIEVESELEKGSVFTIYLKSPGKDAADEKKS